MSTYALCFLQSKGGGHESCFTLYSSGNNICEQLGEFTSLLELHYFQRLLLLLRQQCLAWIVGYGENVVIDLSLLSPSIIVV